MLDLAAVAVAFPSLSRLAPLGTPSGQKDVLSAQLGGELVVLKLIKKNPLDQSRTEREITAAVKLACSYVPRVFEQGQRAIGTEDRVYIIEQRIDGETYREQLRSAPKRPVSEVLGILETLLLACMDFETAKMVHRDIKPENIMIDSTGKLWVIDFGIVRFLDEVSLTPTGNHFGLFTPGYGAPEQVRNLKTEIDIRADLFSVGVVAYEALNGSNPYHDGKGDQLQVINHVLTRDLPLLSQPRNRHQRSGRCNHLRLRRPRSPDERQGRRSDAAGDVRVQRQRHPKRLDQRQGGPDGVRVGWT
jgi:serine/threonine-protein kinase